MVIVELFEKREDGVSLYRRYSDKGFYIKRNDGVIYEEAIDIENTHYSYSETNVLIKETEE